MDSKTHSLLRTPHTRFMAIEPIKIPQNVHIEDRIVGPLTLKQIIIVAIGCGFSYALYAMIVKQYGVISLPVTIMVWIPGAISGVFAFIRINDLSMLRLCFLLAERINKPSVRTWAPRRGIVINIRMNSPKTKETQHPAAPMSAEKHAARLEELSSVLDRPAQEELKHQEKDAPLSPMEEKIVDEPYEPHPVDPSRISASAMEPATNTDTLSAPTSGAVSIFRDLSPSH